LGGPLDGGRAAEGTIEPVRGREVAEFCWGGVQSCMCETGVERVSEGGVGGGGGGGGGVPSFSDKRGKRSEDLGGGNLW